MSRDRCERCPELTDPLRHHLSHARHAHSMCRVSWFSASVTALIGRRVVEWRCELTPRPTRHSSCLCWSEAWRRAQVSGCRRLANTTRRMPYRSSVGPFRRGSKGPVMLCGGGACWRPSPCCRFWRTNSTDASCDVAVEQTAVITVGPSRRTVTTRCFELDMPSGEARERLARARFAVRAVLDRRVRR